MTSANALSDPTTWPRWKIWWVGARPRTLSAAIAPVMLGTAAAWASSWEWWSFWGVLQLRPPFMVDSYLWKEIVSPSHVMVAFGALIVSLALQIGTNYANDYSDGVRGTDDNRVGPLRLTASGLVSPGAVKRAAVISFGVAALVGAVLSVLIDWRLLLVGVAALAAGWLYTGGPKPLGYSGLGELLVLIFFGFVATAGSFYLQRLTVNGDALLASCAVGFLAVAIMLANNIRDVAGDAVAGKRTLVVRIGERNARVLFAVCYVVAFGAAMLLVWPSVLGVIGLAILLALATPTVQAVISGATGPALIPVLVRTGAMQLAVAAVASVALLI